MKMQGQVKLNDFIHLFKHGIRTISRSNWVSASGFQISVAGLFGVAGFVLALRDGKLGKLSSSQWLLQGRKSSELADSPASRPLLSHSPSYFSATDSPAS